MPTVKCICQLQPEIEFSVNNNKYSPHLVFLMGKNKIDSTKIKKQVFVKGNWWVHRISRKVRESVFMLFSPEQWSQKPWTVRGYSSKTPLLSLGIDKAATSSQRTRRCTMVIAHISTDVFVAVLHAAPLDPVPLWVHLIGHVFSLDNMSSHFKEMYKFSIRISILGGWDTPRMKLLHKTKYWGKVQQELGSRV